MTRRKEQFPAKSCRYLEGKLQCVSTEVMSEAAKIAELEACRLADLDGIDPLAYTVEPKHIEQAWERIIPTTLRRVSSADESAIDNALLIGAASALLEACRLADDAFGLYCDNASDPQAFEWWIEAKDAARKSVRAAIVKATEPTP